MASKSPPGLTPIIPVTRCELPVKRASGVASKAKKSASLPVLRRRRGRALSWRKAWIDIQRGGPTGWTNKTCAARRPGNAAERQNRKPSAHISSFAPRRPATREQDSKPHGARLSLPKHGKPGARPSPRGEDFIRNIPFDESVWDYT